MPARLSRQLRNDYELTVYNGDLGTVRGVVQLNCSSGSPGL
jgi:hypothetical protein